MWYYGRPLVDREPCVQCAEYLLEIGFAPGCPGCDREVLMKRLNEIRVCAEVAKRQPGKPQKTVRLAGDSASRRG